MKMFIGGEWVDASDGGVQEVINPATGTVVDTVPAATEEDVQRAIENAVKVRLSGMHIPPPEA